MDAVSSSKGIQYQGLVTWVVVEDGNGYTYVWTEQTVGTIKLSGYPWGDT